MKVTDRIKKIKKLKGDQIKVSFNDEYFTQIGETAEIIDLNIVDLFNIELVVKIKGILRPLGKIKDLTVFREEKLPLVKKSNGAVTYFNYECNNIGVKNIFFTKNDYDSSLIKEWNEEDLSEMEEILRKLKLNVNVKKNFISYSPTKELQKLYSCTAEEAQNLLTIGLTPFGWRNNLDDLFFISEYFDEDIVYEINNAKKKIEELIITIGIIKLTKERKR